MGQLQSQNWLYRKIHEIKHLIFGVHLGSGIRLAIWLGLRLKSNLKKINKDTLQLNNLIVDALQDLKAEQIMTLDLRELDDTVSDFYIVCHGNSNTQVSAIKESIEKEVREALGEKAWHVEGTDNAEWILMDYVNVVVHIFQKETREFYNLEGLWADAIITNIED